MERFDTNDVEVFDAVFYTVAHIDMQAFLALRMSRTIEAGDAVAAMLRGAAIHSAMLIEQGVASVYEAAGDHGRALSARLEALAMCPRYDGWFSALLLGRTARSLMAVGRPQEALPLAQRALRFQPLDLLALTVLADVYAALGEEGRCASIRAFLFDVGVSPAYLPGEPSADDLAAVPYAPDLGDVEPLDDEQMARFLVHFRADIGLEGTLANGRRYLGAQARFAAGAGGQEIWHATKATVAFYRDGSPRCTHAARWLGLPLTTNLEYIATDVLLDAVEEAARRFKSPLKRKGFVDRLPDARTRAIHEAVEAGEPAPRFLLTDLIANVATTAAEALPNDPLVRTAAAIEADEDLAFAPRVYGELPEAAVPAFGGAGVRHEILRDGLPIVYPTTGATIPLEQDDDWFPHLAPAPNARAKCRACKQRIEAGEMRLEVRSNCFPVDHVFAHSACAKMHRRLRTPWAKAAARCRALLRNAG